MGKVRAALTDVARSCAASPASSASGATGRRVPSCSQPRVRRSPAHTSPTPSHRIWGSRRRFPAGSAAEAILADLVGVEAAAAWIGASGASSTSPGRAAGRDMDARRARLVSSTSSRQAGLSVGDPDLAPTLRKCGAATSRGLAASRRRSQRPHRSPNRRSSPKRRLILRCAGRKLASRCSGTSSPPARAQAGAHTIPRSAPSRREPAQAAAAEAKRYEALQTTGPGRSSAEATARSGRPLPTRVEDCSRGSPGLYRRAPRQHPQFLRRARGMPFPVQRVQTTAARSSSPTSPGELRERRITFRPNGPARRTDGKVELFQRTA